DDVRSERMSKFYRHVPQSAETDHANFLALRDAPVMHRRVGRDPGTEQRRSPRKIEIGWDAQNEVFVDNDSAGVPTVGETSEVFVRGVESEDHVGTELLKAGFALRTGTVRINHAADRGDVARLELGHGRADFCNTADDLMAGHNRVIRGHELAPLVADRMEIGVTDAAEENFDLHVPFSWIATIDFSGGQPRCRARSGVSLRVECSWMHTPRLSSLLRTATESHAALSCSA